ncbi:TPA: hypothetical protein ACH3X2_003390 [Trebouxia sp. C0005]
MDQFELPNAPMYMYLQLLTGQTCGTPRERSSATVSNPREKFGIYTESNALMSADILAAQSTCPAATKNTVDSKHKADQREYHHIKHYDTQGSRGYNIAMQDPTHSRQSWHLRKRGLM